jgi:(p)ppGpp synthase/HD superfamily hydrolase
MSTLERAIIIAAEGHKAKVDKGSNPYILHPLRVMLAMTTNDERIVGVLHDVVEDCPEWTIERLRAEGFSEAVLVGLDSVTERAGETYDDFVKRAGADPIGRRVKLADMVDNSDLSRIATPTEKDHARIAKYRRAIKNNYPSAASASMPLTDELTLSEQKAAISTAAIDKMFAPRISTDKPKG